MTLQRNIRKTNGHAGPQGRPNGKPHRFYLTDNERAARANVVRLEGVWQGVKDRWNNHHADDMAAASALWHTPDLASRVSGWKRLGENVGRAT